MTIREYLLEKHILTKDVYICDSEIQPIKVFKVGKALDLIKEPHNTATAWLIDYLEFDAVGVGEHSISFMLLN